MPSVINGFYSLLQIVFFFTLSHSLLPLHSIYMQILFCFNPCPRTKRKRREGNVFMTGTVAMIGDKRSEKGFLGTPFSTL